MIISCSYCHVFGTGIEVRTSITMAAIYNTRAKREPCVNHFAHIISFKSPNSSVKQELSLPLYSAGN